MIQSDPSYRYVLISCLCLLVTVDLTIGQVCQKDVPDFFHNVNLAGPVFDQSVYVISVDNFSVGSPLRTTVFQFAVQPQSNATQPSFVLPRTTARALNITPGIITVTSSDPSFAVVPLTDNTFNLVTNVA
jgi:hypothetical protein